MVMTCTNRYSLSPHATDHPCAKFSDQFGAVVRRLNSLSANSLRYRPPPFARFLHRGGIWRTLPSVPPILEFIGRETIKNWPTIAKNQRTFFHNGPAAELLYCQLVAARRTSIVKKNRNTPPVFHNPRTEEMRPPADHRVLTWKSAVVVPPAATSISSFDSALYFRGMVSLPGT